MIMGMCIGCSPYNAEQSVITQAIAVLRRFGSDAHVYLPGVGMLNGLQAGNYLDSAGTTAGTVDQPVGLVLDAGGSLGVELCEDVGFNDPVYWATTQPTSGSVSISGGVGRINSVDGSVAKITKSGLILASKFYLIEFDATVISGSGKLEAIAGAIQVAITTTKRYSTVITGMDFLIFNRTSACDFTIDNISVREVTGIHATQPTTASKPILRRGAVNLLTWSGDFTNAAWTKANSATISGQSITCPVQYSRIERGQAVSSGQAYTVAAVVIAPAAKKVRIGFSSTDSAQYSEHVGTGVSTLVCATITAAGATIYPQVSWAESTSGSFDCIGAALFQGAYTAAQIQALGGIPLTTTAPASTALGSMYWSFDGSNDSLDLPTPPFQFSDDHWFVAVINGTRLQSDFPCAFAAGSGPSAFIAALLNANGTLSVRYRDDSSAITAISAGAYTLGTTTVVSARKVGSTVVVRRDGVQVNSSSVAGVFTLTGGFIGKYLNSSTWGGSVQLQCGKGAMSDADLLLIEKYAANIAGVQI